MKQTFLALTLISTVFLSAQVNAAETDENFEPFFVVPDILIYRPIGFALTVVGTGLFAAISPLTAFAQISPPHDAFKKTADILIFGPGKYTFDRPVGDISFSGY